MLFSTRTNFAYFKDVSDQPAQKTMTGLVAAFPFFCAAALSSALGK